MCRNVRVPSTARVPHVVAKQHAHGLLQPRGSTQLGRAGTAASSGWTSGPRSDEFDHAIRISP
eukprot:5781064-Alexandrium_andersonii.AAC.1